VQRNEEEERLTTRSESGYLDAALGKNVPLGAIARRVAAGIWWALKRPVVAATVTARSTLYLNES
jgi:hypothetical protein